jgi:membrane-bound lytic murein transglycosylase B
MPQSINIWQRNQMQGPHLIKSVAMLLAFACAASTPDALISHQAAVAQDESGFNSYLIELGNLAVVRGVKRSTVDAVMPTLVFNPRVVALDRAQPGGPPGGPIPKFAPYRAIHVDAARIRDGRAKYTELRSLLARVERETGVPESIMVAIWGHETNYGRVKGTYDLAEALATLAYEGRRRQLFADEFIAVLKMMDRGYPRYKLKGSWAGATGHPQFLPSMYLRLGRDGDGDGRADIWDSEADALASIANYFVSAGWKRDMPWGVPVQVPATLNREALANRTVSPRCPRVHDRHSRWKSVAEWKALGVLPLRSNLQDRDMASFFQPDGPNTPAWLLTGNYRVILDYNCSNFYALSVGLLSDAVGS